MVLYGLSQDGPVIVNQARWPPKGIKPDSFFEGKNGQEEEEGQGGERGI